MSSLREAIEQSGFTARNRIYLAPAIPQKQLSNAAQAYDLGIDVGSIVVLLDNTMMGSGKDGCLLCEDQLIVRESFSDPESMPYSAIKSLTVVGSKVTINGIRTLNFQMPAAYDTYALFSVVAEWIASTRPAAKEAPKPAAVSVPAEPLNVERVRNNLEMTILRFRTIFRLLDKDKAKPIAEHAMAYFDFLRDSLKSDEYAAEVQAESDLIYTLADHFIEAHSGREALKHELMQSRSGDSTLVELLRSMIIVLKEHADEDTKNDAINEFMR